MSPSLPPASLPPSSRRDVVLAVAGYFGLIFLAYIRVWNAGFIWDDDAHLTGNPCITGAKSLLDIWTSAEARICPLTLTTFWLEYQIWGLNPLAFHLVNVGVHALNAVLLWRVLLGLGARAAWFGAALWALHPVQVETVAWITELKNTQSVFFFLLTVLAFIRWRKRETGRAGYALVVLGSFLAMASKSSTVVLPMVLGLCWWWLDGSWRWRNALWLLPIAMMSALSSLISIWTQVLEGGITDEWHLTTPERLIVAGKVVWAYLDKLLRPYPQMFIYPRWELHVEEWVSYIPSAAVLLTGFLLWRFRARWRAGFLAFALFVVLLLPVLGLVDHFFLRYSFVGDHFQYLASMAPLALTAAGLAAMTARWKRVVASLCGGLLIAVLGLLSWHHSRLFENSFVLWRHTLANNPKCWLACSNLAYEFRMQGDLANAAMHVRRALVLNPRDVASLLNLSCFLDQMNRTDEAIEACRKALEIYESNPQGYNQLGTLLLKKGNATAAVECFEKSIEHGAIGVLPRIMLGTALIYQGQTDQGIAELRQVLVIRPESGLAHANLCLAFLQKKQIEEALHHGGQAVRHEPDLALGYNLLGAALAEAGRVDEAQARYQQAVDRDPGLAAAHYNLACLLRTHGQMSQALLHFEAASLLLPVNEVIATSFAWMLATSPNETARNARRALEVIEGCPDRLRGSNAAFLRSQAAALAAVSRFQEAQLVCDQAISLLGVRPSDIAPTGLTISGFSLRGTLSDAELLKALHLEKEEYRQMRPVLDPPAVKP
jgi:tetratricopeptide (TPR) repeat protein